MVKMSSGYATWLVDMVGRQVCCLRTLNASNFLCLSCTLIAIENFKKSVWSWWRIWKPDNGRLDTIECLRLVPKLDRHAKWGYLKDRPSRVLWLVWLERVAIMKSYPLEISVLPLYRLRTGVAAPISQSLSCHPTSLLSPPLTTVPPIGRKVFCWSWLC